MTRYNISKAFGKKTASSPCSPPPPDEDEPAAIHFSITHSVGGVWAQGDVLITAAVHRSVCRLSRSVTCGH